jgi:hypothetical protein
MSTNLSPVGGAAAQFLDNNGNPLTGGKLFTYEAGTTTPQATFTTFVGNVAHANPIILDAAGRVPGGEIWLTPSLDYKFSLFTSADVLIATWDNIVGINGTGFATNANAVAYDPAGSGAVQTTVQTKLRESVSVKDFGADPTGLTDSYAAIQAAEDYATSLGAPVELFFPAGVYAISASIEKKANVNWVGSAQIERLGYATATGAAFGLVVANGVDDWTIDGLSFKNVTRTRELAVPLTSSVAVGASNTCIDVFDCSRWAIRGCTLRQFAYGILYRECQDFQIVENWLYADTGKTVAQIENGTYTNFSSYAGTGGIINLYKPSGPNLASTQYLISGNYIEVPGLDIGIDGLAQTYDKLPSTISNNIIKGCFTGIQLYRGSFPDPGTAPTYNTASIVMGNRVYASWGAGIYLRSVIGAQVIGNYFERCGAGGADGNFSSSAISIRVNPFGGGTVTSSVSNDHAMIVQGNRIVNYGRNDIACDPAVLIENDNVLFDCNEVNRAEELFTSKRGVAIFVGNGKKLKNCTVTNNKVTGYWTRGIEASETERAVSLNTVYLVLRGNILTGNFDTGIAIDWRSFNVDVSDNIIKAVMTTGIRLRNAPYSRIVGNRIRGATNGIQLAVGNLASDSAYYLSGGTISRNIRRGGSLIITDNDVWEATTSYQVIDTSGDDAVFYGRCLRYENNYQDGSKVFYDFSGGTPLLTGNAKIWSEHDISLNSGVNVGTTPGKVCITPGQYGSTTTTTGDTTNGSPTITNVALLDGYGPGIFITATGFSGVRRIVSIDVVASTITVDANATSDNVGVTLTAATPTFGAMPNLV